MSGLPPRRRALLALAVVALAVVAARTFGDDPSVASPPDAAPAAAAPSTTVATTGSTRATIGVAPPSTLAPLLTTTSTAPFDPWSLRPPAPAADPGGLAAQIVAAETILRDAGAPEPAVAQAALAQQVAYRQLGLHPEWDGPVLAAVPPSLQLTVLRQAYARREFLAMHGRLAPEPPTGWRIVAPAPLDQLFADYQEAQQRTGIPWPYLAAVNLVETSLGRIQATPPPVPWDRCSSSPPRGPATAAGATSSTCTTPSSARPATSRPTTAWPTCPAPSGTTTTARTT
jgi:hypothetical protein